LWEWFVTTITDVDPTELIAVKNRSHKIPKLTSGFKKASFSIKLVALKYNFWRIAAGLSVLRPVPSKSRCKRDIAGSQEGEGGTPKNSHLEP
jgi:hypothetical protein